MGSWLPSASRRPVACCEGRGAGKDLFLPIENLPLRHVRDHGRRQSRLAIAATVRRVRLDAIGVGDLPQRAALVAHLATALLARLAAQAFRARRFLQSVAGRRLAAVRAVLVQPTFEFRDLLAQLGVLSPQRSVFVPKSRVLPPNAIEVTSKRIDQGLNVRRTIHPSLESDSPDLVPTNRHPWHFSPKAVAFRTHRPDAAWVLPLGLEAL